MKVDHCTSPIRVSWIFICVYGLQRYLFIAFYKTSQHIASMPCFGMLFSSFIIMHYAFFILWMIFVLVFFELWYFTAHSIYVIYKTTFKYLLHSVLVVFTFRESVWFHLFFYILVNILSIWPGIAGFRFHRMAV